MAAVLSIALLFTAPAEIEVGQPRPATAVESPSASYRASTDVFILPMMGSPPRTTKGIHEWPKSLPSVTAAVPLPPTPSSTTATSDVAIVSDAPIVALLETTAPEPTAQATYPTDGELVDQIFGWPGRQLVQCESAWNRWAVGAAGERGLGQIHPLWRREIERLGWTWDDMFLAEPNIRMMLHIRNVQGLRAWTCWTGAA